MRRPPRRSPLVPLLILASSGSRTPLLADDWEAPPVLDASSILPRELARGPDHEVEARVTTDDLLQHFRLRSTFGPFDVDSREMLEIRVREVYAISRLDAVSKTSVFTKAFAESTSSTYASVKRVVDRPRETAHAVPAGASRFLKRAYRMAQKGVDQGKDALVTDEREKAEAEKEKAARVAQGLPAEKTAEEKTRAAAGATGDAAKSVFGWNRARREWAKKLEVDPYTTNPVLAKKLDDVAWAAFAGGMGFNVVLPPVPLLGTVKTVSGLAWDVPPEDVEARNDAKMERMGVPREVRRDLFASRHFPPTLEIALVDGLEALDGTADRAAAVAWAATSESEIDARWCVAAVRILGRYREKKEPVARLFVSRDTLVGVDRSGSWIVPLPVETLAWTEEALAQVPSADEAPARHELWLLGTTTPRARKELEARGWTVSENTLGS
jgi:hypothetical protein